MILQLCHYDTAVSFTGKNHVLDLGFYPIDLPSNVFTVVLGTLNMLDGTDPKMDKVKPKVRNTIFPPVLMIHLCLINGFLLSM